MKRKKYRIEVESDADISLCGELVRLQREIWGLNEVDVYPPWALLGVSKIGGLLIVVYDEKRPIALAVLTPAVRKQSYNYLYLVMTGVAPDYRYMGIAGDMLNQARESAKRRDFRSIKWTFDPLEAANANLYLKKLGAKVHNYFEDYYGRLSGRDEGGPTDRFWAELSVDAVPYEHKTGGNVITLSQYDKYGEIMTEAPPLVSIEIPEEFVKLRASMPEKAGKIRLATRHIFKDLFERGYEVNGFYRDGKRNFYTATMR